MSDPEINKEPMNFIYVKNPPIIVGIYCIENTETGHIYIGRSIDIRKRISGHLSSLKSNKHETFDLQQDFNKYGEKAFSFKILQEVDSSAKNFSQTHLDTLEWEWIDKTIQERGHRALYNKTVRKDYWYKTAKKYGFENVGRFITIAVGIIDKNPSLLEDVGE